jgi:sugar/nucleoside kinase (ribokinase family)
MLEPHATSEKLAFDDLGPVQLAKGYGSRKLLRLRRVGESPVVSASTEAAIKAEKTLNSLRDAYDVVGIGALNTDYIATAQSLRKLNPGLIAEHEQFFELGKERPASKEEVTKVIQTITRGLLSPCLGGSSFNTIHALASALPDLRLSFIGVAGASDARRGFTETLHSLDVDTRLLKSSEQESGICVSYISRGERSLLTWPGVNLEMAEFLRENRAEIIATLGRAKLVHVTSFFDAQSPAELAGILREAKYQNPWLQISFDPGHDWVRKIKTGDQSDPIREIMDLSTYLFLNQVEFELLGNDIGIKDDQELAEDIFEHLTSQTILILLKRYDEIRVFHRLHKRVKEIKFSNEPLAAAQIEDATGAGDVFAAGLFIAILVPGLELRDGVNLGLHLVRKKLLGSGCSDYPAFARIVDDYIDKAYANAN